MSWFASGTCWGELETKTQPWRIPTGFNPSCSVAGNLATLIAIWHQWTGHFLRAQILASLEDICNLLLEALEATEGPAFFGIVSLFRFWSRNKTFCTGLFFMSGVLGLVLIATVVCPKHEIVRLRFVQNVSSFVLLLNISICKRAYKNLRAVICTLRKFSSLPMVASFWWEKKGFFWKQSLRLSKTNRTQSRAKTRNESKRRKQENCRILLLCYTYNCNYKAATWHLSKGLRGATITLFKFAGVLHLLATFVTILLKRSFWACLFLPQLLK